MPAETGVQPAAPRRPVSRIPETAAGLGHPSERLSLRAVVRRGPVASPAMPRHSDPLLADVRHDDSAAVEARLVAALQRGEPEAFATLVREHGRPLLATARRMLGNDDDANDALQETFLSAFRAIAAFEAKSRLGTWLHRIAVNTVLMKLRARRRRPEITIGDLVPQFTADGHHAEPPCPWSEQIARLHSRESRSILWRGIERLPDAYREVLVLRDIEGLSTEETSLHLGATCNAVKIRLHRARQALRTLLSEYLEDLSP
jgi:RNA polymerase sigma-70 factor (ECF subfamily)